MPQLSDEIRVTTRPAENAKARGPQPPDPLRIRVVATLYAVICLLQSVLLGRFRARRQKPGMPPHRIFRSAMSHSTDNPSVNDRAAKTRPRRLHAAIETFRRSSSSLLDHPGKFALVGADSVAGLYDSYEAALVAG